MGSFNGFDRISRPSVRCSVGVHGGFADAKRKTVSRIDSSDIL